MKVDLSQEHCRPAQAGEEPLSAKAARALVSQVPGWTLEPNCLRREVKFSSFAETMRFVNQVAEIADAEDHHPDIHISYTRVTLELSTHKIGGLSRNDFILAARINGLL
jgi:4a-hydroxytetrahydrobiopterin dehydratase